MLKHITFFVKNKYFVYFPKLPIENCYMDSRFRGNDKMNGTRVGTSVERKGKFQQSHSRESGNPVLIILKAVLRISTYNFELFYFIYLSLKRPYFFTFVINCFLDMPSEIAVLV